MKKLSVFVGVAVAAGTGFLAGCTARRRRTGGQLQLLVGLPGEWELFAKQHAQFVPALQPLYRLLERAHARLVTSSLADRIVFHLGQLCSEDFKEIILLCGNGQGIGGLKILRGLYERAVTLAYISGHPDEADDFWDYFKVHRRKMLNHAKAVFDVGTIISTAKQEELESDYQVVKSRYEEDVCRKCGTIRVQFAWKKGGLEALARATTEELQRLYLHCYYWPTLYAHSTVNAIVERLELVNGESYGWKEDAQHNWVEIAVSSAHGW